MKDAAQSLPQARQMPPQQVYPILLDQLIDAQALLLEAQQTGLDKDPDGAARDEGGAGTRAGVRLPVTRWCARR